MSNIIMAILRTDENQIPRGKGLLAAVDQMGRLPTQHQKDFKIIMVVGSKIFGVTQYVAIHTLDSLIHESLGS